MQRGFLYPSPNSTKQPRFSQPTYAHSVVFGKKIRGATKRNSEIESSVPGTHFPPPWTRESDICKIH